MTQTRFPRWRRPQYPPLPEHNYNPAELLLCCMLLFELLFRCCLLLRAAAAALAELGLGQRVEQRAEDGDGRADLAEGGDGVPEDDDRSEDDDNALDGVSDGMGDGVDLRRRKNNHE